MKTLLRAFLLMSLLSFELPAFCQQDIVVDPHTANRGQRLQVLFSGLNVDFNQGSSVQLFFTQGSGVAIYPEVFHIQASNLASGIYEIPLNADCGTYALESYGGFYYFPDKLTVDCSAQIAGHVYFDTNGNGVDDGEPGVGGATILIQPVPGNQIVAQTDINGNYSAFTSLGSYTVSVQLPQYHQLSSATTSYNVTLTSGNNLASGNDFGINYDGTHNDLEVSLASTNAIAGFSTSYWVNCSNAGTSTQVVSVSLDLDSNLTFNSASIPLSSTAGGLVTWNGIGLFPGESINILVDATVAVVFPNTALTISAQIASAAIDETPDNNVDTLFENVLSSYDPNDKLVEPAGVSTEKWTLKDEYLTYTVRFQNTGNFQAFNIRISDLLDQNLDYSTLKIISSSHSVEYLLKADVLTFYFNNIMLPDSGSDLSGSNGYVQYHIKPKTGLSDGVVIHNMADIYFDFNPAVTTNMTQNKLVDVIPTGILDPATPGSEFFKVYPNPAEKNAPLTIEFKDGTQLSEIDFISIYTEDGKEIQQINSVKERRLILTELSDYHGIVFIQVQYKDKAYYSKAVKF